MKCRSVYYSRSQEQESRRVGGSKRTQQGGNMKIAVSSDERNHLVDVVIAELNKRGYEVEYFGPVAGSDADWPEVLLFPATLRGR